MTTKPFDTLGRPLRDLRISVTDRCNFRCTYCLPKTVLDAGFTFLPHGELLSFEEITRIVRAVLPLGLVKVRITGGEPLLRRDLEKVVRMLRDLDRDLDLALTTNGSLLSRKASLLAAAGLDRATVSLDALDDETFQALNDVRFPVTRVLEGIEAAREAGLSPVKVNAVIRRGVNEHVVSDMVERFRGTGVTPRFIEYMDVGRANGWRLDDVVPAAEILAGIRERHSCEPVAAARRGEVARRWRYTDGEGEFGIVASVTRPFCGDCTRLRLTSDGRLFTCLFGTGGTDLKAVLRGGAGDREIAETVAAVWGSRADHYSELRSSSTSLPGPREEMSRLGG